MMGVEKPNDTWEAWGLRFLIARLDLYLIELNKEVKLKTMLERKSKTFTKHQKSLV